MSRLAWRLESRSGSHVLELRPALVSAWVTLLLDGRVIGKMPKPTPRQPVSTLDIAASDVPYRVLLIIAPDGFSTDLFRDGVLVSTGQALGDVVRRTPGPLTAFEAWTDPGISGISTSRLVGSWAVGAGLIGLIAGVVGVVIRSGLAAAVLLSISFVALMFVFLRTWFILTARARRYLINRSDLGDNAKLVALSAVFLAVAAVGVVIGLLVVALLAAL